MREMKDSGIEWIGEIPVEWNLDKTKRFFTNTKKIVGTEADKYDRLALTLNGVIKRSKDDSEGLQPEKFEGYQILCKNELVFKLIDLENVKTSRVGLSPYTGLVSPAYIVLSNNFEDNRFFYYWFIFMYYNKVFNHLGGEGVRSALNSKDVLSLLVPDIRFDEQCRIADYLDRKCNQIDAIIARQQEVIEKLKAYKLSVITEAVTKGLNPDVPMKDSGIEWIGKTPKHWQLTKIKWVADTCSGGTPPSGDLSFYDGGINWVCSYDLHEDAIKCTQRTLSEEGAEIIAGKMQKPNSILIAMYGGSGTIGNSGILSCYARTNQAVCSVYFDEKLMNPKFALYQTIFMRKYWMYYAVGSRKDPNISQDTIRNMHYIIPPMQEQEAIVEWIESRINVVECIQRKKSNIIEKLADYKKSLIYEVVTGKKEV